MMEFKLKGEYIELIKLLKATNTCETGGEAKMVVDEGLVKVNGEVENRKRLKVRAGDLVEFEHIKISVIPE
ncbi:RNA-binding S4 domain-containing protein [Flexithrix dorotheae]|uniref:RNA-binding S4 domain-containing protein n=1 Tax=Flexithrix dorotheae TaxID=70993 RepID=UPI0003636772|nr:RNA-binding S4 domain-containing protein [Flexithrix dorotheae]